MENLARRTGKEITISNETAKEGKHSGICWDEKSKIKQQASLTMQHEEINEKILAKEQKLKR